MSLFAESAWEADAVGDKISKEFSKKGSKKVKRPGKTKNRSDSGPFVSAKQFDEARKNVRAVAGIVGAAKAYKSKGKKTKRSRSIAAEESTPKKLNKTKRPGKNVETKTPTKSDGKSKGGGKKFNRHESQESKDSSVPKKKLLLSKNEKSVIVAKKRDKAQLVREKVKGRTALVESKKSTESANDGETKSRRRRMKRKSKKNADSTTLDDANSRSNISKKLVDVSQTRGLDVQRIEKLLAMKRKSINGKGTDVKEPESLRERMMAQLRASRFRFLNETLYNNESSESKKYFKEDPEAFNAYHTGYRQQVEQWPLNPLDIIISSINKMPKEHVIADFGCGEARLAESVQQKVHSFDLVAVNDNVKACDMAHTPLLTNGVNVVVFCLSLMGTNLADYLLEANRVLKNDGILKIADVESRFENVDEFIKLLGNYGFTNTWKDLNHNLFYFMDFKKVSYVNGKTKNLPRIALKPCLYKKR